MRPGAFTHLLELDAISAIALRSDRGRPKTAGDDAADERQLDLAEPAVVTTL